MTQVPLRSAAAPRTEASPAVAPRTTRDRDGLFIVDGPMRIRVPEPAAPRSPAASLAGDERERRDHIRRWARMMIVHLERADFDAPQEDYVPTLQRLQHLVQREIDAVQAAGED
jgi:hypothetical protein